MTGEHLLYGVEGSYYAAKVRCYLIKKNIPFREMLADRRAFDKVILPRVGYPIVPIVITPQDEVLQDTTLIIDALEHRFPENPLVPADAATHFIVRLVELYADEWFKIPALHYRWHYDSEFAIQMMGENNDPGATPDQQRRTGAKIAAGFRSWPKHLGVDIRTQDAVERLLADYLRQLDKHLGTSEYILGSAPSVADCALMGPLYAHLYRDPYSGAMIRRLAPSVCHWISRMREPAEYPREDLGKTLPSVFIDLMRQIARDYVPMVSTAIRAADDYLSTFPHDEALPRYIGKHRFTIGCSETFEAQGERSVHTVEIWKLQRLLQRYKDLPSTQKELVAKAADAVGAASLLDLCWNNTIQHRAFKFHVANSR